MSDMTVYEFLKTKVKPCKLTIDKKETIIRCPICGDSVKSKSSTHLYIQNKTPFKYYCQRCSSSGIFGRELISKLSIYDYSIDTYLKNSYDNYMAELGTRYGDSIFTYINEKEPIFKPNQYNELELKKIDYINNRLGINISESDLDKYRIILNMEDYFTNNNLTKGLSQFKTKNIKNLNQNHFSFLLNDKNVINSRNMDHNHKNKHYKLKIIDDYEKMSRRFYSINNEIDLSNELFNINIAEGFFDIISIYENIYNKQDDDATIFIANNGKGFLFSLDYLSSLGILNANINIYSDNDVTLNDYKKIYYRSNISKLNGMNIYYNLKDEDFGVPGSRIEVSSPNIIN